MTFFSPPKNFTAVQNKIADEKKKLTDGNDLFRVNSDIKSKFFIKISCLRSDHFLLSFVLNFYLSNVNFFESENDPDVNR